MDALGMVGGCIKTEKYVPPADVKKVVRFSKRVDARRVESWNLLNAIIPSYGRYDTFLPRCLKSIVACTVESSQVAVTAVLHRGDTKSAAAVAECLDGTGIRYEILWEDTTRSNLPVYYNLAYEKGRFGRACAGAVQSMVGDDMVWKTPGWERILLGEINKRNGIGLFYCAGYVNYHSKLAVNLWATSKYIDAASPTCFMPPQFPGDMIDVVWQIAGEHTGTAIFLENVIIEHRHTTTDISGADSTWLRTEGSRREGQSKCPLVFSIGNQMAANLRKKGISKEVNSCWALTNARINRIAPVIPQKGVTVVRADSGDNVISYMAWGDDADHRYRDGITDNIRLIPKVYPGWRVRVHVERDWNKEVVGSWRGMGAEIVCREGPLHRCWTLRDLGDEQFNRVLLRDADSRVDIVEAAAVKEWVETGIVFHTIRDHRDHSSPLMVGLTGSRPQFVGEWYKNWLAYWLEEGWKIEAKFGFIDTSFLKKHVWPVIVSHSLLAHDDSDRFHRGDLKLKRPPNWPYFCGQRWINGKPQEVK